MKNKMIPTRTYANVFSCISWYASGIICMNDAARRLPEAKAMNKIRNLCNLDFPIERLKTPTREMMLIRITLPIIQSITAMDKTILLIFINKLIIYSQFK